MFDDVEFIEIIEDVRGNTEILESRGKWTIPKVGGPKTERSRKSWVLKIDSPKSERIRELMVKGGLESERL